jgi:hypothetical protein
VLAKCPACGRKLCANSSAENFWINFTCPRHGNFSLSDTLIDWMLRKPEYFQHVSDYLNSNENYDEIIHTYDVFQE